MDLRLDKTIDEVEGPCKFMRVALTALTALPERCSSVVVVGGCVLKFMVSLFGNSLPRPSNLRG